MLPLVLALCFVAPHAFAQVPVVLAPVPKIQFFDSSGRTLAFGCVFSYTSGTTNALDTYTDSTGTVLNSNPLVLDAGGYAGSGSDGMWLQAGQAYRLTVKAAGGSNCASGATLYSVDGLGGGTSILTSVITYSTTPAFPIQAQNQLFEITLTGDAVAQPLTAVGILPPAFVVFQITQDGSGGHSFTWPSNLIGGAPIGTTAAQVTTQMFVWNGTDATAIGPAVTGDGPDLSTGDITMLGNLVASGTLTGAAYISTCANPATVGALRLCKTDALNWRNEANGANQGISQDSSNRGIWSWAGGLETTGTVPDLFIGGTTSSFPRLKRSSTAINFRLGDDSADAPITASTIGASGPITSSASTYSLGGTELSTPSSPSAGSQKGYFKASKGWCSVNSAGTEYCGSTGSSGFIQAVKKTSSTCTVAGGTSYETCSDTLTWPVTFGNTNYVATCSGKDANAVGTGVGNQSELMIIQGYTATTITVITQQNRGGGPDANFQEIHCIGVQP